MTNNETRQSTMENQLLDDKIAELDFQSKITVIIITAVICVFVYVVFSLRAQIALLDARVSQYESQNVMIESNKKPVKVENDQ